MDCAEEQRETQEALASLKDVLQAHISHLVELVPHQPCLSSQKTEQLHIGVLSHLLVGRATLEAQAQLRLDALERYTSQIPSSFLLVFSTIYTWKKKRLSFFMTICSTM